MSLIEGAKSYKVTEFRGMMDYGDTQDVPVGNAIACLDSEFSLGSVRARRGFGSAFAMSSASSWILSMYYFFHNGYNKLAYVTGNDYHLHIRNLQLNTEVDLGAIADILLALTSVLFVATGNRLIIVPILVGPNDGTIMNSTEGPWIWDGSSSNVERLFQSGFQSASGSPTVALTTATTGAGVVTAGTHYFGVIFKDKCGHWTPPCPFTYTTNPDGTLARTLVPASFAAAGGGNVVVTATPSANWPTWVSEAKLIVTTALNPYQYYVLPGSGATVNPGTTTAVNLTFNVSDIQLTAIGSYGAGTLADEYFDLYVYNSSTIAVLKGAWTWGQRMVYIVTTYTTAVSGLQDFLLISDQQNHQWVTLNNHSVMVPGIKTLSHCFEINGTLYVLSSTGGLYALTDNGGKPSTFAPPQQVDASIIPLSKYSTSTSQVGSGMVFIGAKEGLYLFNGGSLPKIPLSYKFFNVWKAINKSKTLKVVDNPQDKCVYISANLYGYPGYYCPYFDNTVDTLIAIDYSKGLTVDTINFSIWMLKCATSTKYKINCIELVKNDSADMWELYVGPGNDGVNSIIWNMLRKKSQTALDGYSGIPSSTVIGVDKRLFQDNLGDSGNATLNITGYYVTSPLPPNKETLQTSIGINFRAKSSCDDSAYGTPSIVVKAGRIDQVGDVTVTTISNPVGKQKYLGLFDVQSEQIIYSFELGAVSLTEFTHYYNEFAAQR